MKNKKILLLELFIFLVFLFLLSTLYESYLRNKYYEECYSDRYSNASSEWQEWARKDCSEKIGKVSKGTEEIMDACLINHTEDYCLYAFDEFNVSETLDELKENAMESCIDEVNQIFTQGDIPSTLAETCKALAYINYQINIRTPLKFRYLLLSFLFIASVHFILKKLNKSGKKTKKEVYECEKCGKEFNSEEKAEKHEKQCKK